MMTVITGGSGSGKSAYAENYICERSGNRHKYYIATMKVSDTEGEKRIERHRRMRQGKGFITIEQPTDIPKLVEKLENLRYAGDQPAALLECMSNLVANEMFQEDDKGTPEIVDTDTVCQKISEGIRLLRDSFEELVIVTNNVFEDGRRYDAATMEYLKAMGLINQEIAAMADRVIEVVVGIPVRIKG